MRLRNITQNGVSKIADAIAGSRRAFYAKPAAERRTIRETAKEMYLLGVDFITAQKAVGVEKRGFVYVIHNASFPGYVKIGRAYNPQSRLNGYQTGSPHRNYKLYDAVYFEDCHFAEQEIHARLDDCRAAGEWFEITPFLARHNINKLRSII